MKRTLLILCAFGLLSGCTQAGSLPPDQVLERATQASQTLQSAHFTVHATANGTVPILTGPVSGTIDATGVMQNAGNQLSFTVNAQLTQQTETARAISLQSDIVVAGPDEVYMRLDSFSDNPPSAITNTALMSHLLNQWWRMPGTSSGSAMNVQITPDPELLRMQTQVVTVTKDHGIVSISGHKAYLYDVTVDPAKLQTYLTEVARREGKPAPDMSSFASLSASGQMWIDADTFVTHQISWKITSNDPSKPLSVSFMLTLTDHNQPVTITPPANASVFPVSSILPSAASSSSLSMPQMHSSSTAH